MNARSAVFSLISLRPNTIRDMIERFPYSAKTLYSVVEGLEREGLVVKSTKNGKTQVNVSDNYRAQKLKEIHIQSLSRGIDPEFLLRKSTLSVWKTIDVPRTLNDIKNETGLSERWIRKTFKILAKNGLVRYQKRKPILVVREDRHVLNRLLKAFMEDEADGQVLYHPGTSPFKEVITTPDEIEKILYQQIEGSLAVKDTGFLVKGQDTLTVIESVEEEPSMGEIFLRRLSTPEGIEDSCIRMIASKKIDFNKLLSLANEMDRVNETGCYLEILNTIKQIVDPDIIHEFYKNRSKRGRVFLDDDKKYGKDGWEEEFEKKWNLDLYLDLGAMRHGVRSV